MALHQCRCFQHLHIFHPLWILFNWTFISQQTPHKASFIPFADVMWYSLLPRLLEVQRMRNHSEVRVWICWHLLIYTFNGSIIPNLPPLHFLNFLCEWLPHRYLPNVMKSFSSIIPIRKILWLQKNLPSSLYYFHLENLTCDQTHNCLHIPNNHLITYHLITSVMFVYIPTLLTVLQYVTNLFGFMFIIISKTVVI